MQKEDALQIAVVNYLRLQYPNKIFTHCPNGGSRNAIEGAKLKRMGVSPGVPDLLFFNPIGIYTGLAIELKIKPNKPTETQIKWISDLISCGWLVKVCYSFDEAKEIIDSYFNQKNK